jgi:hypothetical protein
MTDKNKNILLIVQCVFHAPNLTTKYNLDSPSILKKKQFDEISRFKTNVIAVSI